MLPRLMSGEIDVSKVDLTQLNSHLPKRWYVLLQIQGHPYIPATAATAVAQACVGTMKVWYFLEFGTTLGPLWSPDKEKGHKLEPVTWCFWSRGLDLNQRPPDYEDYLGAIQACYVSSITHVMCVFAANGCQILRLQFGSMGRFGSNSAPLGNPSFEGKLLGKSPTSLLASCVSSGLSVGAWLHAPTDEGTTGPCADGILCHSIETTGSRNSHVFS